MSQDSQDLGQITRWVITGPSGSGKSTTARAIANTTGTSHVELDSLFWGPHWTRRDPKTFDLELSTALNGDAWVVDGHYRKHWPRIWTKAEALVWLDLPRPVTMRRLITRSLKRAITRRRLWHGNRETLRGTLLGRDALIWWAWKSHSERQREVQDALRDPCHRHLKVFHLKTPSELNRFLRRLKSAQHHV